MRFYEILITFKIFEQFQLNSNKFMRRDDILRPYWGCASPHLALPAPNNCSKVLLAAGGGSPWPASSLKATENTASQPDMARD